MKYLVICYQYCLIGTYNTAFCVLISPCDNIQNYLQLRPIPGPNIEAAAADAATEAAADR